jgi:hypothetical protein
VGDLVRALPKEMPALDALQAKLGGPDFEVVAVNIDTRNPDKAKAWLKRERVDRLAYYADNSAKVFQDLKEIGKAFGMPTTLLIDPPAANSRRSPPVRPNGRARMRSGCSPASDREELTSAARASKSSRSALLRSRRCSSCCQ